MAARFICTARSLNLEPEVSGHVPSGYPMPGKFISINPCPAGLPIVALNETTHEHDNDLHGRKVGCLQAADTLKKACK